MSFRTFVQLEVVFRTEARRALLRVNAQSY